MLRQPTSINECVYFTNRTIGNGKIKAWVFKGLCPKCKKSIMEKPRDPKTGKLKIRAKEYVCSECGYTVEKEEYEKSLMVNINYVCPHCGFSGEVQIPFKRKKVQVFDEEEQKKKTMDVIRFDCSGCGKHIDITKRMK